MTFGLVTMPFRFRLISGLVLPSELRPMMMREGESEFGDCMSWWCEPVPVLLLLLMEVVQDGKL